MIKIQAYDLLVTQLKRQICNGFKKFLDTFLYRKNLNNACLSNNFDTKQTEKLIA